MLTSADREHFEKHSRNLRRGREPRPPRFTPFPGVRPKATRTLDAAAVEDLRRSADTYVANWRRYTSGLRRIDHEAQSEAKVRG